MSPAAPVKSSDICSSLKRLRCARPDWDLERQLARQGISQTERRRKRHQFQFSEYSAVMNRFCGPRQLKTLFSCDRLAFGGGVFNESCRTLRGAGVCDQFRSDNVPFGAARYFRIVNNSDPRELTPPVVKRRICKCDRWRNGLSPPQERPSRGLRRDSREHLPCKLAPRAALRKRGARACPVRHSYARNE
jgi:hypothetical protein